MARFSGIVGYSAGTVENPPGSGIFEDTILEYRYRGDVIKNTRRLQNGDSVNADISVNNSIRIVANEYAHANFHAIRYVQWLGKRWKVDSVEVQRPRLVLELGGIYNGPTPGSP